MTLSLRAEVKRAFYIALVALGMRALNVYEAAALVMTQGMYPWEAWRRIRDEDRAIASAVNDAWQQHFGAPPTPDDIAGWAHRRLCEVSKATWCPACRHAFCFHAFPGGVCAGCQKTGGPCAPGLPHPAHTKEITDAQ